MHILTVLLPTSMMSEADMTSISATPPSYDAAVSTPAASGSSSSRHPATMASADVLCHINADVQIYFITPEGYVSAPSYPSSLSIYLLTDGLDPTASATNHETLPAFLQVGDWIYPLLPGQSPVLQSQFGSYIFPDVTSSVPGSSVGVILPANVSEADRQHFEMLLESLTNLLHRQSEADTAAVDRDVAPVAEEASETAETRTVQKVTGFLTTAADWVSWGLVKGAEKSGQLVKYGSSKLRANIAPASQPSVIDPRARQGAYYAHKATECAVKASSFLVDKVSDATAALGRTVAPHVRRYSVKLLPASVTQPTSCGGCSKFDDACDIAASSLKGLSTVFVGLEQSAKILARNIADETVHTVQHKYGSEAGQFTEHVVDSAGGAILSAYCISNLGVKVVAKRAAADSVIAMGTSAEISPIPPPPRPSAEAAQGNAVTDGRPGSVIPPTYSTGARPNNNASVSVPLNDDSHIDNVTSQSDIVLSTK